MGYSKPKAGDGLKGFFRNPFEIQYKGPVGTKTRIRILSLAKEDVQSVGVLKPKIVNPKNGKPLPISVHNIEAEELNDLLDQYGTPVSAADKSRIWRVPVLALYRIDPEKGKQTLNKLGFIEIGPGLRKALMEELPAKAGLGNLQFNEDTGRPDYDIIINVIPGQTSGMSNYTLDPVLFGEGNKQDPSFGADADDHYKELIQKEVVPNWDKLQEAMEHRMSLEDIKDALRPRESKEGSISNKPELGGDTGDDQEGNDQAPQGDTGDTTEQYDFSSSRKRNKKA